MTITVILVLAVLCVSCGTAALVAQATTEVFRLAFAVPELIVICIGLFGLAVLL